MEKEIKELRKRLEGFLISPVMQEPTASSISSPNEINQSKYINEATKQAILEILHFTSTPNDEIVSEAVRPATAPRAPHLDRAKSHDANDRLQALRVILPQPGPDINILPKPNKQHDSNKPLHNVSFSPFGVKLSNNTTTFNSFKSEVSSKSKSLIISRQSDLFSSPLSHSETPYSDAHTNDQALSTSRSISKSVSKSKSRYNVRNSISRFQAFVNSASPMTEDFNKNHRSSLQTDSASNEIDSGNAEGDVLIRRFSGVLNPAEVAHALALNSAISTEISTDNNNVDSRRTSTVENSNNFDSRRTSTVENSINFDSRRTSAIENNSRFSVLNDSRRPSHVESINELDGIESLTPGGGTLTSRTRTSIKSNLLDHTEIPQVVDDIHGRLLNRLSFNKFRSAKIIPAPSISKLPINQNFGTDAYGLDEDTKINNSTLFFQAKGKKYHPDFIPKSHQSEISELSINIPTTEEPNLNTDENISAATPKKFNFNDFNKIGKRQAISAALRPIASP